MKQSFQPYLGRTTGPFAKDDRFIGRGDIEDCRAGVGAERFIALVGVLVYVVEVRATTEDRRAFEGERSMGTEFRSRLRSLKCCEGNQP